MLLGIPAHHVPTIPSVEAEVTGSINRDCRCRIRHSGSLVITVFRRRIFEWKLEEEVSSLFRIVHVRGAIPNEVAPIRFRPMH